MPDGTAPIYVIKKKKGHAGHHGGAWKVAYADFVTAMMALFIVLWLLSSSESVKKAVGGYFSDPSGTGKMPGSPQIGGGGEGLALTHDDMAKLKEKLEQAMKVMPEFNNFGKQVEITVTADGLRVELIETEKGMFFESGVAKPTEQGNRLLTRLAEEMGKLPNKLAVEGHTDAKPFGGDGDYSNWELSADRANAARRAMQRNGLRLDQVTQVRGFADQRLRLPKNPESAANRRISVIVHYMNGPGAPKPAPPAATAEKAAHPEPLPSGTAAALQTQPQQPAQAPANGKTEGAAAPHTAPANEPKPAAAGAPHTVPPAAVVTTAKPSPMKPAH